MAMRLLDDMIDQYFMQLDIYKRRKPLGPKERKVLEQFLEVGEDTPRAVWNRLNKTHPELSYKRVDALIGQLVKLNFLEKTGRVDERSKRYAYHRLTELGLFYLFSHSNYITMIGPTVDIVNVFNAHRDAGLFKITLVNLFSQSTIERLTQSLRMLLIGYVQDMAVHLERGLVEFKEYKDDSNSRLGLVRTMSMVITWNVFSFLIHYSALYERHPENIQLFAKDDLLFGIIKAAQKKFNEFVEEIEHQRKQDASKK